MAFKNKEREREYYKQYRIKNRCNQKKYMKEYYKKNKDKLYTKYKNYHKQYQIKNKDKIKKYQKEYYSKLENKIKWKECKKEWEKRNRKRRNRYRREQRKIPEVKLRQKIWRREYRQQSKYKLYSKEYKRRKEVKRRRNERNRKDIRLRLSSNIAYAIRRSLHKNKNGYHWEDIVNYSLDDLKQHLQKQFKPRMNWKNYGKYWNIDHRIPISHFNFNSYEDKQFKECWSLGNLKPMKSSDNFKKQNHYSEPTLNQILKNA